MQKDQPTAGERRDVPNVSVEKADKQLAELAPKAQEAAQAPRNAQPGSHPLCPIDSATASDLFFAKPEEVAKESGQKAVWDTTAYGAPIYHRF